MVENQGNSSRFKGPEEKQGYNFGCAMGLAIEMPCALQGERRREKEEERKRKGKERGKKEKRRKRKRKQEARESKNKKKKKTRMQKNSVIEYAPHWTCPLRRNEPTIVLAWWNQPGFFPQHLHSCVACGRNRLSDKFHSAKKLGNGRQCSTTWWRSVSSTSQYFEE